MTDTEKFEAFKKNQIQQNEAQYGEEIREKYGEKVVEQSNQKLAEATKENDPGSVLGQEVATLHQQWLKKSWPADYYTKENHYNLSLTYIEDARFKAYYEKIQPGAAKYLNSALKIYLKMEEAQ